MESLKESLERVFRSRYLRMLEEEVARLRSENRSLLNSLLGTAGIAPVGIPESAEKLQPVPRVRKRSWPQIQAWRERDAERSSRLEL
jgi:hypothetical protein